MTSMMTTGSAGVWHESAFSVLHCVHTLNTHAHKTHPGWMRSGRARERTTSILLEGQVWSGVWACVRVCLRFVPSPLWKALAPTKESSEWEKHNDRLHKLFTKAAISFFLRDHRRSSPTNCHTHENVYAFPLNCITQYRSMMPHDARDWSKHQKWWWTTGSVYVGWEGGSGSRVVNLLGGGEAIVAKSQSAM